VTVKDTETNELSQIFFVISLYSVCEDMSIEIDDPIERMIVLDKDRAVSKDRTVVVDVWYPASPSAFDILSAEHCPYTLTAAPSGEN
jgi:hypothetical protein